MFQLALPSPKPVQPKSAPFLSIPPVPPDRNLRVLDLASPGSAAKGYSHWRGPVDVTAISNNPNFAPPTKNHYSTHVHLHWQKGELPSGILSEPQGWYDHVHLHMMTGWLNRAQIRGLFGAARDILQPNSYFFLSYDTFFFDKFGQDFSPVHLGLCRDVQDMLVSQGFAILSSHYRPPLVARKDGLAQHSLFFGPSVHAPAPYTSPAIEVLANDIGIDLSNPWVFLSNFSAYHQFAISFLIAQKIA